MNELCKMFTGDPFEIFWSVYALILVLTLVGCIIWLMITLLPDKKKTNSKK